jgi:hypothetical protein
MADYRKIMDRIERGNLPELQAKLDAAHKRLQAMVRRRRLSKAQEVGHDGHSSER